ncbi:MAG: hypothetical protein NZ602_00785 [Thermoguttaceae bacterium]|nr:hypothetical protein [Thermoguttaceae bacterium]
MASLGFFYMAARTLKTHQVWRESVQKHEQAIQDALLKSKVRPEEIYSQMVRMVAEKTISPNAETIQRILKEAESTRADQQNSLRLLKLQLDREILMRGRVWRGVQPAKPPTAPDEQGDFELMVELTEESPISARMIVYLFEEKPAQEKGRYLGEFKVSGVGGKQLTLKPAKKLDAAQYRRLAQSRGPWVLYERLPMDGYDLFEGLSEEQLRAMMPEADYQQILKHGKLAEPDDPPDCVVDGKYQRPLVDFALAIGHAHRRRSELIDLKKTADREKATVDKALATAQQQQKVLEDWKRTAEQALAQMQAERDVAAEHLKEVESTLAAKQAEIQKTIASIQDLTRQIARIQLEVSRKIEQRVQAALQAAAEK